MNIAVALMITMKLSIHNIVHVVIVEDRKMSTTRTVIVLCFMMSVGGGTARLLLTCLAEPRLC